MQFISSKFDEMGKRLEKLELLEKTMSAADEKLIKLWLNKRVPHNEDGIDDMGNILDQNDFQYDTALEDVQKLHDQGFRIVS